MGLLLLLVALYDPVAAAWSKGAPSSSLFIQQRYANPVMTPTTLEVASPIPKRFRSSSRNRVAARKQIIQSKPRPTVTYDPTAGTVTEAVQESNTWGSFKSKLYSTVDAVGSAASKLRRNKDRADVRPPMGGYNDVIEGRVFTETTTTSSQTPAQRLMKEYQQKGPALEVVQPAGSAFDSFKESVYSAADGMFQEKPKAQLPPVQRLQSFKAATQPSIAASVQVREALPQLNSRNPVKRWMAERKIRHWEDEQRKRDEALERERQIESIKESVYAVVDTVQAGAVLVAKTPDKIVETASATKRVALGFATWAATLPDAVQFAANSVAAIPAQVSQTVAEVQDTVDATVKSTQQFVEDVVSIPQKVQRTVTETQQNVENTVKAVDNTVTNVKVWTGLEEPAPPPPPPPKELTFSNIAWELAGGLAQGGAQVTWWLGKGAVQLGFKGAKSAFVAATAGPTDEQVVAAAAKAAARQPKPPQGPPPASVLASSVLDIDITEALQLAQTALKNAENNESAVGNDDIEEAVRLAKEAAIAATRDAVEIEDIINKKKDNN
eukprot:CAMPEP_0119013332 /NCGR_PEP_ID=MMETSP1176-20130426/8394_1 /TAXON_ID=265551 /ORGANISM="Synedropsis recta cf, Strain CCMP1620" /LENGTH=552 /DNA_ID=CAMNT_0006966419 /DNA_START=179 /DNA_END=1837 /DNA_ORIENTATION=+